MLWCTLQEPQPADRLLRTNTRETADEVVAECPSYIPWAKELSTNSSFGGCWALGHHQSELIIPKVTNKIDLHNNLKSIKFLEFNLDIMRKKNLNCKYTKIWKHYVPRKKERWRTLAYRVVTAFFGKTHQFSLSRAPCRTRIDWLHNIFTI